jgi:Rps23 Pro-64 3,4-dihydroxylase Tpa1-like proline 4-hydroxylase
MHITSNSKQYLIVDDFFNESELYHLWNELDTLQSKKVLQPPHQTAGAIGDGGDIIKKNSGIFLDDYYENREDSSILNMYDKYICTDIYERFSTMSPEFKYAFYVNFDRTLLNYYENDDHYKPHTDAAILTCLYWCYKEPKAFEGGDLTLHQIGEVIGMKNNRLVIFPSHNVHSVSPVSMEEVGEGKGRYCISKFLFVYPSVGK